MKCGIAQVILIVCCIRFLEINAKLSENNQDKESKILRFDASSENLTMGLFPGEEVVGGREVPVGRYNYTTGLRKTRDGKSFCGATLIHPSFLVTAAHCVSSNEVEWVAVGTHYNSGEADGQIIRVASIKAHPMFNQNTLSHDIAIIKLSEPANMQTAALPNPGIDDYAGNTATLHGWGRVSYPGEPSSVLQEVDVNVIPRSQCLTRLGKYNGVDNTMICAGGMEGQSSCHGDSGGPLVLDKNSDRPTLIGIVSWGLPCARGFPDVYTHVSKFRDFIDENVKL